MSLRSASRGADRQPRYGWGQCCCGGSRADHEWAVRTFDGLEPPLYTCEPVLAEIAWLVRNLPDGPVAVLDLLIRGVLRVEVRAEAELLSLRTLLTKYASVPMSLADACLVRMTELDPLAEVVTLDGDFRTYRRSGRLAIRLIMPQDA